MLSPVWASASHIFSVEEPGHHSPMITEAGGLVDSGWSVGEMVMASDGRGSHHKNPLLTSTPTLLLLAGGMGRRRLHRASSPRLSSYVSRCMSVLHQSLTFH